MSRHVAGLERSLGVHLVNRTARTISLTEAGTRYAEFATRIVEEIDRDCNLMLQRASRVRSAGPAAVRAALPGTHTTARVRLFLDFVSDWFRKQAPGQQSRPTVVRAAQAKSA